MIKCSGSNPHWNYFLALEQDLDRLSRFIEFSEPNLQTYSIELAHLLLTIASEVDVVVKALCKLVDSTAPRGNMDDYRKTISKMIPEFAKTNVAIPRYGMTLTPWETFTSDQNPNWWKSYNRVKHQRDECFGEATLQNALTAMGALLIVIFYQRRVAIVAARKSEWPKVESYEVLASLQPEPKLVRFPEESYWSMGLVPERAFR